MQLRLGFELETGRIRPQGAAVIDLTLSAVNQQIVVTVTNLKLESSNIMLDLGTRMLAQPLRELLAQELSAALNQAIADLPQQVSALKKIEILDIHD